MAKKSNPTTRLPISTKTMVSLLGTTDPDWPMGIKPSGDRFLDTLSIALMKDVKDKSKNYTSLAQWCIDNDLYPQEMDNFRARNETVEKAVQYAFTIFGERRENELRNGAPAVLAMVLPQYNKTWRKERDERAQLKANIEGKGNQTITVMMQPIPEITKEEK